MKKVILLLLIGFSLSGIAQTVEVSGVQSGVWEADTIRVTGDVVVQDSLRIQAGTTVLFENYSGIMVGNSASLKAIGTAKDSILFTVADTTGFHIFNSGRGGWNGISLKKAGSCQFDYCRFQYGKASTDEEQDGGALRILNCDDVEITNSTLYCNFSREHGGALSAENSKVMIQKCEVDHNLTHSKIDTIYFMYGGGMRFLKCEVQITQTNFLHNTGEKAIGGALSLDNCAVAIDRCKFMYNYSINGGGLYLIDSYDLPGSITNSLFAHNTSGHFGGGFAIRNSSPLMANLTVANNHSIGVNCGGIFFYQNSAPAVWNCIVYGNTNESVAEAPVQMWTWTYDDDAPEFHNCLVQFGLENIASYDRISVYENCIDADPLFYDDDYTIWDHNSPCYNGGSPDTPAEVLNGFDLNSNPRVWDGIVDIGAYEMSEIGVQETAQKEPLIRIVGNPITASSYAEIELEDRMPLTARVVSMDGRLVNRKNLGNYQAGMSRIALDGLFSGLSSGTYLLVFQTSSQIFTTKVVKP